ncbi:uracil-xanthine permease family protein [Corynebacterium liangguodongii]|uniref:Nitrate reductase n=1 Tax=Corynebacterium liangguodongii TaxID=2079535 RepID=A0A2S0WEH2_9CORY|nr:solute carrier family 23 protein [Corynebacterium liangguodongii]AWB84169.1 nitrate reductase [Corynebacterium liangguodongii]PWC00180.1 nitrate reductase [Corynebacterium liangguodongii]
MTNTFGWALHGDGRRVRPGAVVAPEERLSWPRTIGIGMQHVVAMFGATLLVPTLTGFPVNTTLLFSGLGTMIFLALTRNRLPSYLGSSFAFIAPLAASQSSGVGAQLGGVVATGLALVAVGALVSMAGKTLIDATMPPVVTGAIVALIGLNLAPTAVANFQAQPWIGAVTLATILVVTVATRGMASRLSILIGVVVGWAAAALGGGVPAEARAAISSADWVGWPTFHTPEFRLEAVLVTLPVIVVLIAENVGHVKAVSEMTGRNLDDVQGRALIGDGIATALAGSFGGSATTTYAENIGVMAATKVYSTAAYWVAATFAIVLAFNPKFGAVVLSIPLGVLGGACLVLYGMIGMLGVRIWQDNRVDFNNPVNLLTAAVGLIVGIGNLTLTVGGVELGGIALGSVGVILAYPAMRWAYRTIGEGQYSR